MTAIRCVGTPSGPANCSLTLCGRAVRRGSSLPLAAARWRLHLSATDHNLHQSTRARGSGTRRHRHLSQLTEGSAHRPQNEFRYLRCCLLEPTPLRFYAGLPLPVSSAHDGVGVVSGLLEMEGLSNRRRKVQPGSTVLGQKSLVSTLPSVLLPAFRWNFSSEPIGPTFRAMPVA